MGRTDDLISRAALLNDLSYCAPELWQDEEYIKAKIMKQPAVDAVSVVWCKDCKFGMRLFTMSGMLYVGCEKDKMARLRKPNDYCSEGERETKDGGENDE